MKRSTILGTAIIGLAGLLATSCGSDAEALTKEEYVAQADALCREASEDLAPVWDEFYMDFEEIDWDDPANQDVIFSGYALVLEEVVPRWEEQADQLRALAPPEGDAETLETLYDDLEAALNEMEELAAGAAAGDEAAIEQIETDDDPMARVNAQARAYGLNVCGSEE